MVFKHSPVLYQASMEHLKIQGNGLYVDATLGGGGHASGICEALEPAGMLIGIDRDKDALRAAEERLTQYSCQKKILQANYADIKQVLRQLGIDEINGAILDLGVSSFQLEEEKRGFSYMKDVPLDMRMNQEEALTAFQIVNSYSEAHLAEIFKEYGEEKWAKRIALFIAKGRKEQTIETTGQLVEIIKAAIPASARRDGPHPAKRSFQAIRIEVNDELGQLKRGIEDFCDVLANKGRLCVITFHSLEDRIVKNIFNERNNPCTCPKELPQCVCGKQADIQKITGKPMIAKEDEKGENPRARSAKLRVVEKKG